LGIFKHQFFSQERKFNVGGLLSKSVFVHAFLFGLAFGFGWSPCIGPVLAVILYWATQAQTQMYGLLLLIVFGLGLGVPFVLIAAGFEKIVPLLKRYRKVSLYVEKISGVLIILFGLMLLTADFVPAISVIHRFIPSFR
jgi:cytochrome c-type biogenesis protein